MVLFHPIRVSQPLFCATKLHCEKPSVQVIDVLGIKFLCGIVKSSKTCQLKDCERVHNHLESRLFKKFKRMEMVVTWKETSLKDGIIQKSIV
jgi:hypothetical protein